jgi:hypothetical protein
MKPKMMRLSGLLFLFAGILLLATVLFAKRNSNLPTASLFITLGVLFTALSTRKPSA